MPKSPTRGRAAAACVALLLTAASPLLAQEADYHDFDALSSELRSLAESSGAASLRSIGESREGREVWLVEIAESGGEPVDDRPGLLIVGNLTGDHVVGSELALEVVRHLLSDAEGAAEVRANQVVYVVPRLDPDGAEARFGSVLWGRRGNAAPHDDDNDGRVDEDGGEDLNGDGLVTVMRVEDPDGEYLVDPDDDRLLVKADRSKGQAGVFQVYVEGRDDDGDGFYNEDGPGGVDLDRNFQHAYPYWQPDAGAHMVSEPETRALMDFVIAHRNIGAILTFGHSDNLATSLDGEGNLQSFTTLALDDFARASNDDVFEVGDFDQPRRGFGGGGFFFGGGFGGGGPRLRGAQVGRDNDPSSGQRPSTTVHADDRPYFERVAEAYRETTGVTETLVRRRPEGAFFQFGYYQFGVPSFSTPGWAFAKPEEPEETEDGDEESESSDEGAGSRPESGAESEAASAPRRGGPPGAGRGGGGRRGGGRGGGGSGGGSGGGPPGASIDGKLFESWESAGVDGFVAWSSFDHPQLGAVEIGGFRPYAATNPPAGLLADLGAKHGAFAVELASMLPRVNIVDTEVTDHGGGVFTVSAVVENSGYFPTSLRHGVVARAVDPTTIQIQVPPDAVLTGADKTVTWDQIEGSGAREKTTWVIRGRRGDSVEITVRAQKGGRDSATVELR